MSEHDPAEYLPELIAEMERKVGYAAALYTARRGVQIFVDNQEQRVSPQDPGTGIVLTAYDGQELLEYATSTVERDSLFAEARAWLNSLSVRDGNAIDPGPELRAEFETAVETDPTGISLQDRFQQVREWQALARACDPRVINARISYADGVEESIFVNRAKLLRQRLVRTRRMSMLFASGDGKSSYDWRSHAGTAGWEIAVPPEGELESLRDSTLALLDAEHIEPGEYEVIASPEVAGLIAHESFGHGVEMDMFLKGRARAQDYVGKPVASSIVNMYEDPTLPGGNGTYFFDDEGQLATPTRVIGDGILLGGITNLYAAHALGIPRTANGRRESFANKAYARMSNTYFARGTTPVPEMIASVERGVYLQKGMSGMEDPKDWGLQLVLLYGSEIVDGKLTGRLFSPIGVTGYVPDLLRSITMVGDDFSTEGGGMCGKGHKEFVYVSDGGPHLKLRARLG